MPGSPLPGIPLPGGSLLGGSLLGGSLSDVHATGVDTSSTEQMIVVMIRRTST
ncbi:hypothetical protein GCM10027563_03900 [Parasphingorhabdus pacifica]